MNPFVLYFAWKARQRAKKDEQAAERRRYAIIGQKAYRKAKHKAFRYLDGDLRAATEASLRAYVAGRA